ncbi:MAG: BrnA antitoxin family protein [Magnetococcales bacterium]|nr:BrnA antitoxin family protein [Magnetococcales bacterium]
MSGNRCAIGSDLAKVDAHVITPEEYEEIPEMTEADFGRGVWKIGEHTISPEEGMEAFRQGLRRGRPVGSDTKVSTTIRFDSEVITAFRATGKGWQTRMNDALRDWLKSHSAA